MSTRSRSPTADVSTLKTLSIVLAFAAAVGLVFGTVGFSAIDADRGIEVSVVDDEEAYLGVEQTAETVENGTETEVMEYENRFDVDLEEFDVDVSVVDPDGTDVEVDVVDDVDGIGAGETASVAVTLQCESEESVSLAFDVDASGDGVSLSTTDEREVTCAPDE